MPKRCKECERDGKLNDEGHCRKCQEEIDHSTSSTLKITDDHIECALKNLGNISNRRAERWVIVKELFGIGSSRSTKLCQMHNIDPFEVIGKDKCDNCELIEEELKRSLEFLEYFGVKKDKEFIYVNDGHTSIICNPNTEWKDFLGHSILEVAEVVAKELKLKIKWMENEV